MPGQTRTIADLLAELEDCGGVVSAGERLVSLAAFEKATRGRVRTQGTSCEMFGNLIPLYESFRVRRTLRRFLLQLAFSNWRLIFRPDPMKDFRQMKQRGEKITALTAYDYPTARLLDESGIDIILVGDSLGMVVLGCQDTTGVTMEEMLHHTRAAARGVKQALLVADMPIHTYDTPEQAVETARKFVDVGAQAVKLEGGVSHVAQIEAITKAGIPFMATHRHATTKCARGRRLSDQGSYSV